MSQAAHPTSPADVALHKGEGLLAPLIETTKPRITRLVTITSGVGFVMAGIDRPWTGALLVTSIGCMVGTAASAAGANALNQWMERNRDAAMPRTRGRPLPRGTLLPATVFWSGLALCILGVLVLLVTTGVAPAAVSAVTILSYLLIYTPMKPVSPLATLVGAVPGALPPLIGWTAASAKPGFESLTELGAWSLFAIMFVWQIPHFLAIAWLYKEDYAKGGYKVLPVLDSTGRATAATILTWTVLLLPITLAPAWLMPGRLGWAYVIVATVTGLAYLAFAGRLSLNLTRTHARSTFIASVIHLPVLFVAMVAEALGRVMF